ncbi:integrase core domain protein [Lasius niger]|uniref:Integrase core domain protein n=1 Tax=Lasius niger TaxID=67767 RepID=A0A0J7K948_LASNI|nr:integrase core domain protein [Lasius niger]
MTLGCPDGRSASEEAADFSLLGRLLIRWTSSSALTSTAPSSACLKKGNRHEPIAQQTTLGWILSGAAGDTTTGHLINTHQCQIEEDITSLVRRFWEQEEVLRPPQLYSKSEQECEEHFCRHHSRAADGRYIVRLPTIEPLPDLSGTRRAAHRALQHVNRKLDKEGDFRSLYVDFMRQYRDFNHMKLALLSSSDSPKRACYLPHHGVLREGSTTTKLRVVFNGSSSLPNGDSLNRSLMTGPNLLPALADIPLRYWPPYLPRTAFSKSPDGNYNITGETHATLNLRWQPCDDRFSFTTKQISLSTITKRSVLSLTAKLFDPLGWLSPTTVLAKILIQSTWLLGVDWDDPLPDEAKKWLRFQSELPHLESLYVPRWLGGGVAGCSIEVHGFADASVRAYAVVVYLKTERNGENEVKLVAAKTKVAPLKQISLPRLELSAATLLVRLVAQTLPLIGVGKAPLHLWSDSTVTLGWIRGHPSSWSTFVANRVSKIQTSLPDALWHRIPGRDNPADCASRGLFPGELVGHPLWWQGPSWLLTENGPWTIFGENINYLELPERRTRSHTAASVVRRADEPELLLRYSSLQRLLRITSWCLRWLRVHGRTPSLTTTTGWTRPNSTTPESTGCI